VHDALQLRRNAYRVLLTRGRDGTVIYVPRERAFDDTYRYLVSLGIEDLARDLLPSEMDRRPDSGSPGIKSEGGSGTKGPSLG